MSSLSKEQRRILERVILSARQIAEEGAEGVITSFGVGDPKAPSHLDEHGKLLRRQLRAHGRQLGDHLRPTDSQQTTHLAQECAYEHWHRMLFARFLAENDLLRHPDLGISLSLDECQELAREQGKDTWELAGLFAQKMLPGIFRADDPVLKVKIPTETRNRLLSLLNELPRDIFLADDSLGWVYQFWQTERKETVNRSGEKIGADELPAVTQLFTEDYMVEFLLHNTLGAWWTAKRHAEGKSQPITFAYLRLKEDGTPAAGSFDGWPRTSKEIRLLDPCMGSGHFLVFAFPMLVRFRIEEEGLSVAEACVSVLRDNLFGLELDPRCTQIAAFNLAMAAWKFGDYQVLPQLNIACSGLSINSKRDDWLSLSGKDEKLRRGMEQLYQLFQKTSELGSLINPRTIVDLLVADFHELQPLMEKALAQEDADIITRELAVTACGITKAVEILANKFTLVTTNVPYLGRGKHNEVLRNYCEKVYPDAKADLATCFVERCIEFCAPGGSTALVTPHNWLFLGTYKKLRKYLLEKFLWDCVCRLGPRAFETISGEVVNVALLVLSSNRPSEDHPIMSLDVSDERFPRDKAMALRQKSIEIMMQKEQLNNPDCYIQIKAKRSDKPMLKEYADVFQGVGTTDNPRYILQFWEIPQISTIWDPFQFSPKEDGQYGGCSGVLRWEQGIGPLSLIGTAHKGLKAYGKLGFAVTVTSGQKFTYFLGYRFDNTIAVLLPLDNRNYEAIGAYLKSDDFKAEVKTLDQALSVTESSFLKVPFDVSYWQRVATEQYPQGLAKPYSEDPTQWLFNGHPKDCKNPLHVATARLINYSWPRQTGSSFPNSPALKSDDLESYLDVDGIVCLTSLRGESSAAERLSGLLAKVYGSEWTLIKEKKLIADTGSKADNLNQWLRDDFFRQHCDIFDQRPFIWHIWDGLIDGFHAFVNYHLLAAANGEGRKTLESLIYSYLGDWITRQRDEVKRNESGADARLAAALKLQEELKKIVVGHPPYDIFVRWKPLHEQPIGWEPDIKDGVRINIRPFMMANLSNGKSSAGVLRDKPNIKWEKDRGKEPKRDKSGYPWFWSWDEQTEDFKGGKDFDGNRWNNCHYSNEFKQLASSRKSSK